MVVSTHDAGGSEREPVNLVSTWFLAADREQETLQALSVLADDVRLHESGTLMYLVHVAHPDPSLVSLPPAPTAVTFVESYRDAKAFEDHVTGRLFTTFVLDHGSGFLDLGQNPFTTVSFLRLHAGFVRPTAAPHE